LNGKCFWLYNNTNEENEYMNEEGDCKSKDDDKLICENVKRLLQCNDVELEGINKLEGECDIYENNCKKKCEKYEENNCGKGDETNRFNDCIWLEGNEKENIISRCANKVSHRSYIYIFINTFFIYLYICE
jgi:hypothetical protein